MFAQPLPMIAGLGNKWQAQPANPEAKTIDMEKQTWTIHKKQYTFDRFLGNGSFGLVYAAHRRPDSALPSLSFATCERALFV